MITRKQLAILNIFQKNEFEKISWKRLKELSDNKSSSVIQNAVKSFLKEDLIFEEKIGTSKLYKLNLDNPKIFSYFEIYNRENLSKKILSSIKELEDGLDKHILFYSIVIFGSYSSGKQNKNSDLDVAVFIESGAKRKIVEAVFKSMELKSALNIDGHVIAQKEFLEMLKVDYENLGKEIARKHLILKNPAIFYSLVKEGIKNGFKV